MKAKRCNTVGEALLFGKKALKEVGVETYGLDCQLLLMKVTGLSKVQLFTEDKKILTEEEAAKFLEFVEKKKEGCPTQYLLGSCEFMGLPFLVNEDVLIPRPDTEILVETVLSYGKKEGFSSVLDICTGSGCIAISLGVYGGFSMFGLDISQKALSVAKRNAILNQTNVMWYESNLLQALPQGFLVDAIVSNPPYIAQKEVEILQTNVKDFEPRLALDGGEDGLDFYRLLTKQAGEYLTENGMLFFEIGHDQGVAVSELMKQEGYQQVSVLQDLAGKDRVVFGKKEGKREQDD